MNRTHDCFASFNSSRELTSRIISQLIKFKRYKMSPACLYHLLGHSWKMDTYNASLSFAISLCQPQLGRLRYWLDITPLNSAFEQFLFALIACRPFYHIKLQDTLPADSENKVMTSNRSMQKTFWRRQWESTSTSDSDPVLKLLLTVAVQNKIWFIFRFTLCLVQRFN